ncbi:AraC family transcriptional regulator [Sphingomonas sp. VNH70]|uniref:AraC family transcriptional regulator n=1 Tax=Sphingomonas silueang TaxID=3156617 RepID=UPI0032B333EF
MTTTQDRYHDRLRRVLDHIDRHPDEPLDLDRLSGIAAFSRHHFHRQFTAVLGMPVHRYVQLARLDRAAHRLAYRRDVRITDIAFDAGYDAPESLSRALRDRLGAGPSALRTAPDWPAWHAAFGPFHEARSRLMSTPYTNAAVTIERFDPVPVAILRHQGDPARIGDSIRRFIAWRRANGLTPAISATYNVFHDDPQTTAPADYRLDLCAATDRPIDPADGEVVAGTIPGGRCAVLRVTGDAGDLEQPARFLYREWLPRSGERLRDFPLYCRRLRFYPDVPLGEAVAELYLPLE